MSLHPHDATSSKPLYEQIKHYVVSNIQAGVFKPHSRVPSERDLAKQFGVSRLTVTKALKELEQAGWVYVRIGKGTFVSSETISLQLDTLMSFTEEMTQRGQTVGSRVLSARVLPCDDVAARAFGVLVGTPMAVLERVRLANDQPIAYETSTLLASVCKGIFDAHDFSKESLYQVLRKHYGITLAYAEQTIEARLATREEAKALQIETKSPVLAIYRLTHDTNDQPLEYACSAYRGDRYQFKAILRNV